MPGEDVELVEMKLSMKIWDVTTVTPESCWPPKPTGAAIFILCSGSWLAIDGFSIVVVVSKCCCSNC